MRQLSAGKRRGLQSVSAESAVFTILALDHGASLAHTMRPQAPETVTYKEMAEIKAAVLRPLARQASAVLLDPVYGLGAAVLEGALPGNVGLILAVEDGDYATPQSPARFFENWDVEKVKLSGATAVKCFFYYHPDDASLAKAQETWVAQLAEDCHRWALPLFAEPLSYDVEAVDRRRVVVETARRISRLKIDVLKVEFPLDVTVETDETIWMAACQEISAVCETPWALLSAGVDFATFARQVSVACRAGASGYLAGRAIWQEAAVLPAGPRASFLRDTAVARLEELATIAGQHGRPWTDFYPAAPSPPPQGWHQKIGQEY